MQWCSCDVKVMNFIRTLSTCWDDSLYMIYVFLSIMVLCVIFWRIDKRHCQKMYNTETWLQILLPCFGVVHLCNDFFNLFSVSYLKDQATWNFHTKPSLFVFCIFRNSYMWHSVRQWPGATRPQTITWTKVDQDPFDSIRPQWVNFCNFGFQIHITALQWLDSATVSLTSFVSQSDF